MMTIEELEKKLTELDDLRLELNAQIAELKLRGEEKPMPPHQRPELKQGEIYYSIESNGKAYSRTWIDTGWDSERLAFGNVFRTKDAAEYAAEYFRVIAQMREWAGDRDGPWKLGYDGCQVEAIKDYLICVTYGELRFACKDDAENCIKAVGEDRLIKYYFGVRDHEIPAETE